MKWLLLFLALSATCIAQNGYIVKTNGTIAIGAGGGVGSAGDGYVCRTNGVTIIGAGGGVGSAGDGYYTVTNGVVQVGGGPLNPNDTGVSGLAYYWNYNDVVQGSTVSSWPDRIQGLDAHQGDATKRPTNSTSGLWFNGTNTRLTNDNITLPASKYTLWLVLKPNSVAPGGVYGCLLGDKSGNNGFFFHASSLDYYRGSDNYLFAGVAGASYDLMYANAGTGSAGGGVGYTNGVATATITDRATAQVIGTIGSDDFNELYQGYIKFIGIFTNVTLTAGDAATLYTYSQAH